MRLMARLWLPATGWITSNNEKQERWMVNQEWGMGHKEQGTGNVIWGRGDGKNVKYNLRLRKKASPSFMLHGTV